MGEGNWGEFRAKFQDSEKWKSKVIKINQNKSDKQREGKKK